MKTTFISQPGLLPRLGNFLQMGLQKSQWTEFRAAIAFVKLSGIRYIASELAAFAARRGKVSISVGIDHGVSSVEGLQALLRAVGDGKKSLWVFRNPNVTFHPKVYLFRNAVAAEVFIGSGNLTKGGLYENYEAITRTELDLANVDDRVFLEAIEDTLKQWSPPSPSCMILNERRIQRLRKTDDLPTEEEQAKRVKAAARKGTSLFPRVKVPPAPRMPAVPKPAPVSKSASTPAAKLAVDTEVEEMLGDPAAPLPCRVIAWGGPNERSVLEIPIDAHPVHAHYRAALAAWHASGEAGPRPFVVDSMVHCASIAYERNGSFDEVQARFEANYRHGPKRVNAHWPAGWLARDGVGKGFVKLSHTAVPVKIGHRLPTLDAGNPEHRE